MRIIHKKLLLFVSLLTCYCGLSQDSIYIYLENIDARHPKLQTRLVEGKNYPYPHDRTRKFELTYSKPIKVFVSNYSIQLSAGKIITVWQGDTIRLHFDKTIGRSAVSERNDPAIHFNEALRANKLMLFPSDSIVDLDPAIQEFVTYTENFYGEKKFLINSFFGDKKKGLQELLIADCNYEKLYVYLSTKIDGQPAFNILNADSIFAVVNQLPQGMGKVSSHNYRLLVYSFATWLTNKTFPDALNHDERNQDFIRVVKESFTPGVADYLLMQKIFYIYHTANNATVTSAAMAAKEIHLSGLDNIYKQKAEKFHEEFKKSMVQLRGLSSAKLKTYDGREVALGSVITAQKPLFIDFWATWCGPCIAEFPHIKESEKKNPGVQFISLSIDEDEQRWKKFIKDNNIDKTKSFLVVDHEKNALTSTYYITNVPRFILFNAKGECVSGNFTRPSDEGFIQELKIVSASK